MNANPETLYHYTTQAGLIGIVESNELWATNIAYMNDAREYKHALELLREAIPSCQVNKEWVKLEIEPTLSGSHNNLSNYPNIYVFSMTKHEDRLGLWRAYGGGASGYSVGLSIPKLTIAANREPRFRIVQCSYDKEKQRALVQEFLESVRQWSEKELPPGKYLWAERFKFHGHFWNGFAEIAARIKDPAFSEEEEWRLVSYQVPPHGRKVRIRQGPSTLTPYVAIQFDSDRSEFPIDSVTIGPTIDPIRAANGVFTLLRTNDREIQTKNIRNSVVPYRQW